MTPGPNDLIYVLSSQVGEVGGAAKATRLLCEALARMGQRVRLFVTLPPEVATAARLASQNIEVVTPRLNKGWRHNLPQKQIAFQLFRFARRERPARILSVSLSLEAKYVLQLPRTSPFYLWETTEALPHVKFVDKTIFRHLHKAAGILAPSDIVSHNIRATYGFRGKIARLPFWCDAPAAVLPSTNARDGHFLYVGRMDLDKGFSTLFEAFRAVQERHKTARLTVCGGGDVEAICQLAQGIPNLEIRGYISNDEYEKAIAQCSAFVLPSLHEGYPLSLLEACARHKPVIATRVGSIPEVFEGRDCALLVMPGDTQTLVAAMLEIIADSDQTYHNRCLDAAQLFKEKSSIQVVSHFLNEAFGSI